MNSLNDLRRFINFNKPEALDAWLDLRDILQNTNHSQNPIDLTSQKKSPPKKNKPTTKTFSLSGKSIIIIHMPKNGIRKKKYQTLQKKNKKWTWKFPSSIQVSNDDYLLFIDNFKPTNTPPIVYLHRITSFKQIKNKKGEDVSKCILTPPIETGTSIQTWITNQNLIPSNKIYKTFYPK